MNDKLKRLVAIIALVLIGIFTVTLVMYLIDKNMFNGGIGGIALWSGAFGLLFAAVLWVARAFPAQEVKDEERARLYDEAAKMDESDEQPESEPSQEDEATQDSPEEEQPDANENDA